MRKNLAKHTAKKLPLAKRVLALCFALIFVCSCLLPAFANGTGAEFDTPDTEVVEAADPGTEPEPMDLYDEPAALDDSFGVADEPAAMDDDFAVADEPAAMDDDFAVADEPAAMDDDFAVADEPAAMDDQVEKPVVDDEPAAMDNEVEKPVEGGEPPVADDTPAKEGATKTTTDANDNIVYEYDTSGMTFPDDDAAALPEGDQVLDKMDAAFSIPTNIYHFWLKKMSSYDLADIADAAKTAEMTVEQYLAMYGTDKGCYHIMTAADGANLKDYQFADPTSNDDPEGNSRTFAGWYYTDDLDEEQEFVFDEHLYVSEGTTVEVYAKWKDEAKPVTTTAEINALETTATVDGLAGVDALNVSRMDEDDEDDFVESFADKIDMEKNVNLYAFDLTPVDKNGDTVQPDSGKKATVTIEGFDVTADDTVKVFHKADTGLEDLTSTASVDANGTLTFKTSSFSPFGVVVERAIERDEDKSSDNVATLDITGESQVEIDSQITLTGTSGYYYYSQWYDCSYHYWEVANDKNNTGEVTITSSIYSSSVTIKGVSEGEVTLRHYFGVTGYNYSETKTITVTKSTVEDTNNATVFLLLTPNSDKDSNATSQWGYGIPGAAIDVSGATGWEDEKNLKGDLSSYIKSWPNDGTQVTLNDGKIAWDMPLTTVGYSYVKDDGTQTSEDIIDQIWRQWSGEIKKQNNLETLDLKKEDIEHIYVVPYKISKGNGTSGTGDTQIKDLHIDSEIRVVCKGAFTAQFLVQDAGASEYTQISSKTYLKGSEIPENNGKSRLPKYPDKKVANGVTYEFDGWYNEADEKVEATKWAYLPTDEELADGTVQFRAKYVPITQNITITKHVTGLFGDKDREFNFSVSFSPAATDVTATKNLRESSTQDVANLSSFTLRHNDSITLNGVPIGTVITITESDASDYTVTATGATGSEQTGDNASFTYTVVANSASAQSLEDGESDIALMSATEEVVPNNSITITNTFDAPVDNGVLLDTLPYILILVVVVGGGVLLFLRKRKNDDDE